MKPPRKKLSPRGRHDAEMHERRRALRQSTASCRAIVGIIESAWRRSQPGPATGIAPIAPPHPEALEDALGELTTGELTSIYRLAGRGMN